MVLGIGSSPSFQDFVAASQRVRPHDSLVLKNGLLEKLSPLDQNESRLNAATWRAFQRAVKDDFTPIHRRAIAARYGLDLESLAKSNTPFERRYVEYFGVAAASPYTFHLQEQQGFFAKNLEKLSPRELHTLFKKATRNSYLGSLRDPTEISGGVRDDHEQLIADDFNNDQARGYLLRGIADLTSKDLSVPDRHPYYSRLEMAVICLLETDPENATLDLVIPAPSEREGQLDYYRVYDILSGGGLNAIALVPISNQSNLDPILCFRCTKQTFGHHQAWDSNIANFNENIGKSGYEACQEALATLIKDPEFNRGKKCTVLSYSQGGAHASYFMWDHWRSVCEFVGFNCVGSSHQIVDEMAQEINALADHEVPPAIYHHRNVSNPDGTEGDWVNRVGQKHLGHGICHPNAITGVYEWLIYDYPTPTNNVWDPAQLGNWLNLHGVRPMDTDREDVEKSKWSQRWKYSYKLYMGPLQVDPILDTYKRDSTLEDLRQNIGYKIVHNFAIQLAAWANFLFRVFPFHLFSRDEPLPNDGGDQ